MLTNHRLELSLKKPVKICKRVKFKEIQRIQRNSKKLHEVKSIILFYNLIKIQ